MRDVRDVSQVKLQLKVGKTKAAIVEACKERFNSFDKFTLYKCGLRETNGEVEEGCLCLCACVHVCACFGGGSLPVTLFGRIHAHTSTICHCAVPC